MRGVIVTGEEWVLAAAVVFSGLWSGLLGMLTLVMHRMLGRWTVPASSASCEPADRADVIVGVYVVSNVWKEPHYDVILAWDPDALPADWEAGRQKYFTLNWIQLVSTWAAFGLFLVALVAL